MLADGGNGDFPEDLVGDLPASRARDSKRSPVSAAMSDMPGGGLEQAVTGGVSDRLQAAVHAELAQEILHVVANGGRAHTETVRGGAGAGAGRQKA